MTNQVWTSYRSLFRFGGVVYRLGRDGKLPVPVRIDSAVVFLFLLVALYVPCWLLEPLFLKTLGVGKGFVALVAAGALTHSFSNFDPAGKFLPFYIWDIVEFYILPKKHRVGAEFRPDKRKKENCEVFLLEWGCLNEQRN